MSEILQGDCLEILKTLPDESIDCCVTSPPYYGLRDYGVDGQIGLEGTPEEYIAKLVEVFHEVKRVLKDDGTLWLNIGDSYNGSGHGRDADGNVNFSTLSAIQAGNKGITCGTFRKTIVDSCKPKDLIGIPWMLAFALRADGWYLRQDIIWHKPNPMPESVRDRCTKSHEYIFLMSKKPHYYFDYEAIQEPAVCADDSRGGAAESSMTENAQAGVIPNKAQQSFVQITDKRNKRDVWEDKGIRFGGNKYGDNNDSHFQTYSGNTWKPKHKNLQYDGQQPNTMHERRAEGLPDEDYIVRNKRDVWDITTKAVKEAHFATYPEELVEPCIKAGCKVGGGGSRPILR